jgi:hypothetical protein
MPDDEWLTIERTLNARTVDELLDTDDDQDGDAPG